MSNGRRMRRAWKRAARVGEKSLTPVRHLAKIGRSRLRSARKQARRTAHAIARTAPVDMARTSSKSWWRSARGRRLAARIADFVNRLLAPMGWEAVDRQLAAKFALASKYDYYWHKANKRIDIRTLDGFGAIAAKAVAEHRTGMRYDRLYTLWQAISGLAPGHHAIVEVGAYKGGSARFIGEALQWHARERPFFVCDTFQGHAVVDDTLDGPHHVGEQFMNTSSEEVAEYLKDLSNIRLVPGDFRVTSGQLEAHAPYAFVHVDVDVYPVTRYALEFFAPRVLPGALIVVDDYGFTTCQGARRAVDEFTVAHPDFRFFHLLTGQALLLRLA